MDTKIDEFTAEDKRETEIHNFDETPEVIGTLVAVEEGTYGPQYKIETEKGEVTVGTYDVLTTKIKKDDVLKRVKIVCKGNVTSPKTKRTYKDFVVYVKEAA
jgi:hypothetical protein